MTGSLTIGNSAPSFSADALRHAVRTSAPAVAIQAALLVLLIGTAADAMAYRLPVVLVLCALQACLVAWILVQADRSALRAAAIAADSDDRSQTVKDSAAHLSERAARLDETIAAFQAVLHERLASIEGHVAGLGGTANAMSKAALKTRSKATAAFVAASGAKDVVAHAAVSGDDFMASMERVSARALETTAVGREAKLDAQRTSETIDALRQVATNIAGASEMIATIADRTNLLALNATIEAARAGSMGRGFNVVAQEVKALAGRTMSSAREIGSLVDGVKTTAGQSIEAIRTIGGGIELLYATANDIADAIDDRLHASAAIATSMKAAAVNVEYVSVLVSEIETVADETAQGVGFLKLAAHDILSDLDAMRRVIHSFGNAAGQDTLTCSEGALA